MKRFVLAIVSIVALVGCSQFTPERQIAIACSKPCLVSLSSTQTINANLIKAIGMSRRMGNDGPTREVKIEFIDKTSVWIPTSSPQKEIERITSLIKGTCN